jgi:hypothetical protein
MLLRKKAQSTAEYAITIGIVVAVVAGVMSVALKGGMRKKSSEAVNFLNSAGSTVSIDPSLGVSGTLATSNADFNTYESEARTTNIDASKYVDKKIVHKGGAVDTAQVQATNSTSLTVESYNAVHQAQ